MTPIPLSNKLAALTQLREYINSRPELLCAHVSRSRYHNQWLTEASQWRMLEAIALDYLDAKKLTIWLAAYPVAEGKDPKIVGLVMAGNIPLVGFHDWLCVLMSGHISQVKLSEKDPYVLPHLVKKLEEFEPALSGRTQFVDRLKGFDAVIATGSDNTLRYFEQYFGKYPHILRGNRVSVAVLHGDESAEQLAALADDVFAYFGLGCRSVAKLYVPSGYDFEPLLDALHVHKQLANHSKWKNNFDYNYALFAINKTPFLATGSIMLTEAEALQSRLATLHYEFYSDLADVAIDLHAQREKLQAIVSAKPVGALETVMPGEGQRPGLGDYADGVDVIGFLTTLG